MPSTFTVTITENATETISSDPLLKPQVRLVANPVYSQTFASLDTAKLIAFLNPVKPKRVYRAKAKTERAP